MCDKHEVGYRENAKPKETDHNKVDSKWNWPAYVAGILSLAIPAVIAGLVLVDGRPRDIQPACHDTVYFKLPDSKSFSCEDARSKMELFSHSWTDGVLCRCNGK